VGGWFKKASKHPYVNIKMAPNGKYVQGTHSTIWVLINLQKIPQMPQNLPAQIIFPIPKVWDFNVKRPMSL
jgi:hypothetical protein